MKKSLAFFDRTFEVIFSDNNQKKIERATLWLSIVGFITHLILIYAKKFGWFHTLFEASLLDDPISAIYTPFSIILLFLLPKLLVIITSAPALIKSRWVSTIIL